MPSPGEVFTNTELNYLQQQHQQAQFIANQIMQQQELEFRKQAQANQEAGTQRRFDASEAATAQREKAANQREGTRQAIDINDLIYRYGAPPTGLLASLATTNPDAAAAQQSAIMAPYQEQFKGQQKEYEGNQSARNESGANLQDLLDMMDMSGGFSGPSAPPPVSVKPEQAGPPTPAQIAGTAVGGALGPAVARLSPRPAVPAPQDAFANQIGGQIDDLIANTPDAMAKPVEPTWADVGSKPVMNADQIRKAADDARKAQETAVKANREARLAKGMEAAQAERIREWDQKYGLQQMEQEHVVARDEMRHQDTLITNKLKERGLDIQEKNVNSNVAFRKWKEDHPAEAGGALKQLWWLEQKGLSRRGVLTTAKAKMNADIAQDTQMLKNSGFPTDSSGNLLPVTPKMAADRLENAIANLRPQLAKAISRVQSAKQILDAMDTDIKETDDDVENVRRKMTVLGAGATSSGGGLRGSRSQSSGKSAVDARNWASQFK